MADEAKMPLPKGLKKPGRSMKGRAQDDQVMGVSSKIPRGRYHCPTCFKNVSLTLHLDK